MTANALPGYLHRYRWRTTERIELKVACAEHGSWHTYQLRAPYAAGTVIRRPHSHHPRERLTIDVQAASWEPAWEAGSLRYLSPAYARAIAPRGMT